MATKNKKSKSQQLSLLKYVLQPGKEVARDNLAGILAAAPQPKWHGMAMIPPGSILDAVCVQWHTGSDIPLEIPFYSTMMMIAARMLCARAKIKWQEQDIFPDPWIVVLAPSGSAKSWTWRKISDCLPSDDSVGIRSLAEPASGRGLIDGLMDIGGKGIWRRDEFGQWLKWLDTTQGTEIKDYMLRVYDNQSLVRRVKDQTIEVNAPALVCYGTSVDETIGNCLTAESLLDGFAQRYQWVIARRDDDRNGRDYPLYKVDTELIKRRGRELWNVPIHDIYHVTDGAIQAYCQGWRNAWETEVPYSFYRRNMWMSFKWAMIYHIVLRDESNYISSEDMQWALRLVREKMGDTLQLLSLMGQSDLQKMVSKARKIQAKVKEKGQSWCPSRLIQGIKSIRSLSEANLLFKFVST